MFNRVVSIFVMAVVLGMGAYAEVVPQDLGSIRVNTPMYTAEGIDNIVSNVVAGIEKDNITDGTNTIDAAGGVYVRRGVGNDWKLVSGNYNIDKPVWKTKEGREPGIIETGWYGYGLDVGYQFLSADFYAMEITGIVEGREYDSESGGMVFHVSTNTWRRTHTEAQFIGKLALTNDIQKVFQLSTNAANNLITAATNGFLRTEQDPAFTVWTNEMDVAVGRGAQANATGATALGYGAIVNNKYGVAVGSGKALGDYAIALGVHSTASGEYDTALGQRITMNGPYGAAVGAYSSVIGSYGAALGPYSYAAFMATALGNNSYAPSKSFGTTYDPEHFYFTSSNDTTTASKRGVTKKSLQAYLDERVATNAIAKVATSGAYSDLTGTPTNVSAFSNDVGYATAADLGGYLPLAGGTLTGDLAVGEEHTASRKLTVASDNGAAGITLQGGTGSGQGSSVSVGGSSGNGAMVDIGGGGISGGRLFVGGGQSGGGGTIEVAGPNGSIKKDGKEVATEAFVDGKLSDVSNAISLLTGAVNSKADKTALEEHVADTNNPHGVTATLVGAVPLVKDAYGKNTAVTVGYRDGTVGAGSLANGLNVTATGNFSHAEGDSTTSIGLYSHAEGSTTTARGMASHAEGGSSGARGDYSHAEGVLTGAVGEGSHAEGHLTTAEGNYSHADGYRAQTGASDVYAFAWNGDGTRENPYVSHGAGTFNVNPVGGVGGFYIGEQTLTAVISNAVADKADKATTLAGYGITNAATKTELDAKQDKLTKASAPTVGALLLMGDRPSNGVSLDVTPEGSYGALAVKGADNRTSVLTPDGSPVLTQTLGDARYASAEALASFAPESIKKTVDGAKWSLSANLVSTKTTTAAGEASCTLTTQFGSVSLSQIQDRLFSGVLDGIGNVAVWWDGSAWNWGTHPVPSDPTSMQSVSTDPSSGANATSLSFSDGSKATIALGAGTEVVETSHLATAEAVAAAYVPVTRTVNGKPLSADMVLTAADVGAVGSETDPLFSAWKEATNVLIGAGASTITPVSPFVNNSVAIGPVAKTVPFYGSDGKYKESAAVAIGHGAEAHGYGVAIGKGAVSTGDDVVLGSEQTTGLIVFADPGSFVFRTPDSGEYVSKPLQSFLDLYWKKTDWLVGVPRIEIVPDGLVKCPDYMGTDGVSVCFSADGNDIDDTTSRLYPDGSNVATEKMVRSVIDTQPATVNSGRLYSFRPSASSGAIAIVPAFEAGLKGTAEAFLDFSAAAPAVSFGGADVTVLYADGSLKPAALAVSGLYVVELKWFSTAASGTTQKYLIVNAYRVSEDAL